MKRTVAGLAATLALVGCTSVESTAVDKNEVATQGEPVGVVQANSIGFTAIFHLANVVDSDLDQVVNKLLIAEAKAMGANKIQIEQVKTTPRHGIYRVFNTDCFPLLNIVCFPRSSGAAIAVK